MKALLFPGQGSQMVGMGSEFYKNYDLAKELYQEADEKLNFKISKIILEGPDSELKLTQNTQPAILIVSYIIFNILIKEHGFKLNDFKYFAGHSLGEYSALVCAKSLTFEDALFLLRERGKSMQEAVPVGDGGMLAVLGLEVEEVNQYISQLNTSEVCEIANDNANGQVIVSGNFKSINN